MSDKDKQQTEVQPEQGCMYRVIEKDGLIGVMFDRPIGYFAMPAEQAVGFAVAVIQMATRRLAHGPKSKIIQLREI